MMSQMQLTLPSNSSMDFHPNNTLTNFRTRLHKPLELGDSDTWEVGLSELHYPHAWKYYRVDVDENSLVLDVMYGEDKVEWRETYTVGGKFYTMLDLVRAVSRKENKNYVTFRWNPTKFCVEMDIKAKYSVWCCQSLAKIWQFPA